MLQRLKVAARRALASDFQREKADAGERATLGATVADPAAQDYASWRRSVLFLAAITLAIGALIDLVSYRSMETEIVELAVPALRGQNGFASDEELRQAAIQGFGRGNIDTLELVAMTPPFVSVACALLCLLAARSWSDIGRSRRHARRAWLLTILAPLALAMIPWSSLLDFSHAGPQAAAAYKVTVGLSLGLQFFFTVGPKVLTIFPGIVRSSLNLKTLLPESTAAGFGAVVCGPVFALFFLVILTTLVQMHGDLRILGAIGAFCAGSSVFLLRARDLVAPRTPEAVSAPVRDARRRAALFFLAGGALGLWFLFSLDAMGVWDVLSFSIHVAAGAMLATVASSDLLLGLLHRGFLQSRAQQAPEFAEPLGRRFEGLASAGLTGGPAGGPAPR